MVFSLVLQSVWMSVGVGVVVDVGLGVGVGEIGSIKFTGQGHPFNV